MLCNKLHGHSCSPCKNYPVESNSTFECVHGQKRQSVQHHINSSQKVHARNSIQTIRFRPKEEQSRTPNVVSPLRVGACTTLYAMGFHEMEIKHLLPWKSNAFMTSLCNLAVTSRRRYDALADASCIPNFL